jgi:type IV secretion system protein VirB2
VRRSSTICSFGLRTLTTSLTDTSDLTIGGSSAPTSQIPQAKSSQRRDRSWNNHQIFCCAPVAILMEWRSIRAAESLWGDAFMANRACAALAAIISFVAAAPALAQDSYSDPAGSGVLVSAVSWLQGTLLGTIATVVAVIAVAAVGFMMLTGRINWRYGITVVLGCFILFGATSIVAGIHSTATLGQ